MTCLYFSSKIEKVLQTGPLYTTLEYLHYLQILNKTLSACFYHGVIAISCVFSFFIFLFFRHFAISVSFLFISFNFFFFRHCVTFISSVFSFFIFFFFRQTIIFFSCLFTHSIFIVFLVFFCFT